MQDNEKVSREVQYGSSDSVTADETTDNKPHIIDSLQHNIDPWNATWITDILESIAQNTEDNNKLSVGYVRTLMLAVKEISELKAQAIEENSKNQHSDKGRLLIAKAILDSDKCSTELKSIAINCVISYVNKREKDHSL